MLYFFLTALGLAFILEGIFPFTLPNAWRKWVLSLANQNNKTLRIAGFSSMITGLIIVIIAHYV